MQEVEPIEVVLEVVKKAADANPTPQPLELTTPEINQLRKLTYPSDNPLINEVFQAIDCHRNTGNKKKLRRYLNDIVIEVDIFKIKQYLRDL